MEKEPKKRFPGYFKKALIALGVVLALYTILGFFAVPYGVKYALTEKAPESLHREVAVEKVRFNPYTLELRLEGLEIQKTEGDEPFASLGGLYANLGLSSLFRRALVVAQARLDSPFVSLVRNPDESFNFSDLLGGEEKEKKDEPVSRPFRFSVSNIEVSKGEIRFEDTPKGVSHRVTELELSVPFVSNFPHHTETFVKPGFSAVVNGTPVDLGGKAKPFSESRRAALSVGLTDLDLTHYLAYLPDRLNLEVKKGFLSLDLGLDYSTGETRGASLTLSGSVSLRDVALDDSTGGELLRIPSASFNLAPSRVTEREVKLSRVFLDSPGVKLIRRRDSTLNVAGLVSGEEGKERPKEPERGGGDFLVEIDEVEVKAGGLDFLDYSVASSARKAGEGEKEGPFHLPLEGIHLRVKNFSTRKGGMAGVSLGLGVPEEGSLSVTGEAGIRPVSARLSVDLKGLSVKRFEPYINEFLDLMITGGVLTAAGEVSVASPGTGFTGRVALNGFSSLDRVKAEEFLRWQSLYAEGVDLGLDPSGVRIDRIALTDFFSRLIITKDGAFNLLEIVKSPGEKEDKPQEPAPEEGERPKEAASKSVRIDAISLQGGEIEFLDNYIEPSYSARLTEVAGRVSGLDSTEERHADVSLLGRLNNVAPLEITGRVNPLIREPFADLKVRFTDIELSPLTPYSSKYIGHTIEKGKLHMNLDYLVARGELDSDNRVVFDQFTLGRTVESPDAVKLPVSLAVSLLKDRDGKIRLDLPVHGDLGNPKFSLGKIIGKVIMNLLSKALTSPFALVGALVGGGEELSYLEFDYGSADIDPEDAEKLDKVVKILFERPELKLAVSGYVDREKDREGLRRLRFMRKLKAKKLKDLILGGKEPVPVDEVEISDEEYAGYLERAYEDEDFPKPRNIIGVPKKLPPGEMEKLMLTHTEVTDGDLRLLAQARAVAARDYILETGKVEQGRIFLKEPQSIFAREKDGLSGARVEFGLK